MGVQVHLRGRPKRSRGGAPRARGGSPAAVPLAMVWLAAGALPGEVPPRNAKCAYASAWQAFCAACEAGGVPARPAMPM